MTAAMISVSLPDRDPFKALWAMDLIGRGLGFCAAFTLFLQRLLTIGSGLRQYRGAEKTRARIRRFSEKDARPGDQLARISPALRLCLCCWEIPCKAYTSKLLAKGHCRKGASPGRPNLVAAAVSPTVNGFRKRLNLTMMRELGRWRRACIWILRLSMAGGCVFPIWNPWPTRNFGMVDRRRRRGYADRALVSKDWICRRRGHCRKRWLRVFRKAQGNGYRKLEDGSEINGENAQ